MRKEEEMPEDVDQCPECGALLVHLRGVAGELELFCRACGWDAYADNIERELEREETDERELR